ncbi:hypothetical protein DYB25_009382 [Aphanomyces astaci]|uniref:Methyltransferase domain-containing protein n=2 Tax=Aphanomyces astaci TaxID=112090 RepID=A0A397B708_APHAT|nr:hypothetical protein DYB36_002103 [Aphanomyces astaci]RHY23369.1 hypothetical protein DYB25_009382 [Aphanomyces astaci]RHY40251.1 hypothetical protein DYB30_001825 [Aphanomyces astaci]RHY58561.1 hypothetical protein DYB34_000855 [Aphanomyces astaci]RHY67920.1 hypothetical protein DYB38_010405 [Aphanomyces astaci]
MSTLHERRKKRIKALLLAAAKKHYAAVQLPADTVCIAPFSPSPMEMVVKVWERLRLQMSADDVVVELGCGDARWLLHGVQTYGCRAVGVEYDPQVAALAVQRVHALHLQASITISIDDILHPTYRLPDRTTMVIVYAFAETLNVNVKQLLVHQCQHPRTKVISVGVCRSCI